jgi:IS30 family transposase
MSNNHRFLKFSQFTHTNACETYISLKDENGIKWTKQRICKTFKISRPWFDTILTRFLELRDLNSGSCGGLVQPKSRANHRYQSEDYKSRRNQKLIERELKIAQHKALRLEIAKSRYEHKQSNDMWHMDLKLMPPILGEKKVAGQKQYLLAFVDDCSRKAYFELIDGKNQHQVTAGLKKIFARLPTTNIKSILSDNGKEFKGIKTQHAVEKLLVQMGIKHRYTRVRRPQTNGKVERLNRTVNQEFLTKIQFTDRIDRYLQLRLFEYYYNNDRPHQGINNQIPNQKYQQYSILKM